MELKTFTGVVVQGSKTASRLGFPTANISLSVPLSGIYAGIATIRGATHQAAFFADAKRKILEAYLLDFSGDVYGETAEFTLLEKIREHQHFTDETILKAHIADDVERVRTYFAHHS